MSDLAMMRSLTIYRDTERIAIVIRSSTPGMDWLRLHVELG
jgi:hypothetical protein